MPIEKATALRLTGLGVTCLVLAELLRRTSTYKGAPPVGSPTGKCIQQHYL